jgi:hypothetical protein
MSHIGEARGAGRAADEARAMAAKPGVPDHERRRLLILAAEYDLEAHCCWGAARQEAKMDEDWDREHAHRYDDEEQGIEE